MNLEQLRAGNAFAAVGAVQQGQALGDGKTLFLRLARKLPVMFQVNGLLATWAYLLAKAQDKERLFAADQLLEHFRSLPATPLWREVSPGSGPEAVFRTEWTSPDHHLSGPELRTLTAEAVAFSGWLKRAAEALLDEGKGEE